LTDLHELRLRESLIAFVANRTGRDDRIGELYEARFPAEACVLRTETQANHLVAIRNRTAERSNGTAPTWLLGLIRPQSEKAPSASRGWRLATGLIAVSILSVLILMNLPSSNTPNVVVKPPLKGTVPIPPKGGGSKPRPPIVKIEPNPAPGRPTKDRLIHPKLGHKPQGLVAAKIEVGRFVTVSGEPTFRLPGGASTKVLRNAPLYAGVTVETGDMDKAEIRFTDGTTLAMDFNTILTVPSAKSGPRAGRPEVMNLTEGRVTVQVVHAANDAPFAVSTPVATATVVGTRFSLELMRVSTGPPALKALLRVEQGKVRFSNPLGSVLAGAKTESVATATLAPTPPKRLALLGLRYGRSGAVIVWSGAAEKSDRPHFVRKFAHRLGWAGLTATTIPNRGVVIIGLSRKGAARAAGMRVGDLVLAVNGKPLQKSEDLHRFIYVIPDQRIALTIKREGQETQEVVFTVGAFQSITSSIGSRELRGRLVAATFPALKGDAAKSLLLLADLAKEVPEAPVFNNLGVVHEMNSDIARAIRNYQIAVRLDDREALYRYNLGLALSYIGNFRRAIEELGEAVMLAPADDEYRGALARAMLVADRSQEAIAVLSQGRAPLWTELAMALHNAGRDWQSVAAAKQGIKTHPDDANAYLVLYYGLYDLNRMDEAEAAIRTSLSLDPTESTTWESLALIMEQTGRLPDSEAAFLQAIKLNPNPVDTRNRAMILRKLGRVDEAQASLLESIKLDATYPLSYESLGFLYMQVRGRMQDAEKMFRRAIELGPELTTPYKGLAELGFRTKNPRLAEEMLRKAMELDPTDAGLYNNLAMLLLQTGRQAEAETVLRKTTELDPRNPFRWMNLSGFLKERGKFDDAQTVLREGLKQIPGHPLLLNALAMQLADRAVQLDEALELINSALKAGPEDPSFLDTLGWVHFKRGEYPSAAEQFTRAIKIFGEAPVAGAVWVRLGATREKSGEIEKAKDAYRKALSLRPNNKEAADALKRIGGS
jgi:Flp pilus assembly protein TadD